MAINSKNLLHEYVNHGVECIVLRPFCPLQFIVGIPRVAGIAPVMLKRSRSKRDASISRRLTRAEPVGISARLVSSDHIRIELTCLVPVVAVHFHKSITAFSCVELVALLQGNECSTNQGYPHHVHLPANMGSCRAVHIQKFKGGMVHVF